MATPDPWKNVPINENRPCACSPAAPGVHWRGMVVNAPKQVKFKATDVIDEYGAFAAVPLCVYYMFDVPAVPVHENYKITAVNTKSGQRYEGEIIDLDPGTDLPPPAELAPPTPPPDVTGLASGGYMNPNIINYVALPRESATYEVTLSFRGFKSNSVTIQLIKQ